MINFLVRKRKITLLFFMMLILVGVYSFTGLARQDMPDAVVKTALVTTVYPGRPRKRWSNPSPRCWNRRSKGG